MHQTVRPSRRKIGCPSLIPRMGGSYSLLVAHPGGCPTRLRERATLLPSGATLAHGLALGAPAQACRDLRGLHSVTEP